MRWLESDWYVPRDWLFNAGWMILAPLSLILGVMVVNVKMMTELGNPTPAYAAGAIALVGVILLFFARLPLYRQRKFLAIGPRQLDRAHRKLYWMAYALIVPSVLMMLAMVIWLKT